jgi:hypothetical protein
MPIAPAVQGRRAALVAERNLLESELRVIWEEMKDPQKALKYIDSGQETDRHYGSQVITLRTDRIKQINKELASLPFSEATPLCVGFDEKGEEKT